MLLPDMFDEKVALMGQEEELPESRTAEQGTLIALTTGQMVTLFTTGPDGRAKLAPVEVVLDDAKGAAGEKTLQHYTSARIILHAPGNSDYYKRPQLTDRPPERDTAGETRTLSIPSFISNSVRRRPWSLGIANTQELRIPPRTVPKTASMASTASGADPHIKDAEKTLAEGDEAGEDGVGSEDESDRMEGVPANSWFGGMTRWASKLWSMKRVERPNTPRASE